MPESKSKSKSKFKLANFFNFGKKVKVRPEKAKKNTNKEAQIEEIQSKEVQSEEAKNERARNERARSEKAQNEKSEYEIKVEGFLQQCKIFRNFLGGLNSDTTYEEIEREFTELFKDYMSRGKIFSRTRKILEEMGNKLSKYQGYFDPERVKKYGDIFKFKAKEPDKDGYIKRSAIDDAEVANIFNKEIPDILKDRGKEVKAFTVKNKMDFKEIAFFRSYIEKVTIENEIKEICDNAFENSGKLTTVDLGENCTKIGNVAFYKCKKLSSINLENVEIIGGEAFRDCESLKDVNLSNVTTVGAEAFMGCTGLTRVNLSNITTVGAEAFMDCTSLTEVDLRSIKNAKEIGMSAFCGCSALETVILPEAINDKDKVRVKAIKDKISGQVSQKIGFFNDPDSTDHKNFLVNTEEDFKKVLGFENEIQKVIIGNEIKKIVDSAFSGCFKLETVKLGVNCKEIGDGAFYGCGSLKEINLEHVTKISDIAFLECDKLVKVDLSSIKDAEAIEGGAFVGCKELRFVTLPNGDELAIKAIKKKICEQVKKDEKKIKFTNYSPLKGTTFTVRTEEDFKKVSCFTFTGNYIQIGNYIQKVIIENEIKEIVDYAFNSCFKLKTVKLGENCKTIGARAFLGCGRLKEINLKDVTEIGNAAFYDCEKLVKVDLSSIKDAKALGDSAFVGCKELSSVILPEATNDNEEKRREIKKKILDQVKKEITFINDPGPEVGPKEKEEIPSSPLNGVTLAIDSNRDFENIKNYEKEEIKEVTIGNDIKQIAEDTFSGCRNLGTVKLGENCKTIGKKAFYMCTNLGSINLENVTSIGASAFWNTALTEVDLSSIEGYKKIGKEAFTDSKLEKVILPKVENGNHQQQVRANGIRIEISKQVKGKDTTDEIKFFYKNDPKTNTAKEK